MKLLNDYNQPRYNGGLFGDGGFYPRPRHVNPYEMVLHTQPVIYDYPMDENNIDPGFVVKSPPWNLDPGFIVPPKIAGRFRNNLTGFPDLLI